MKLDYTQALAAINKHGNKVKLADVYENDADVANAVDSLIPGFEYPNHSYMTMTEINQWVNSRVIGAGPFTVQLSSVGNIDHGEDSHSPMPGVPNKTSSVPSLIKAAQACSVYIANFELGGGNWSGGLVKNKDGKAVAEISYNGRIWIGGYTPGNRSEFEPKEVDAQNTEEIESAETMRP